VVKTYREEVHQPLEPLFEGEEHGSLDLLPQGGVQNLLPPPVGVQVHHEVLSQESAREQSKVSWWWE
jgi:hypothetical protein